MKRIIVVGNVSCDRLLLVERLPKPNEDVIVRQTTVVDGGAAANVAAAIVANGGRSALASAVGSDVWGRRLLRNLRARGIDTRFCRRSDRPTTEFVVAMAANGDRTFYVDLAGASFAYDASPLYEQAGATDTVALVGCRLDAVRTTASAMARRGTSLYAALGFWISSGELRDEDTALAESLRGSFMNRAEWARLPSRWRTILADRSYLRDGRFVVITHGANATTILSEAGDLSGMPAKPRRIVNTLGCGDAFMGAFLARQTAGDQLSRCLRRAHTFAARIAATAEERI